MKKAAKVSYQMLMICRTDWAYGRNLMLGARHHAFASGRIEVGNGLLENGEDIAAVVRRQQIDGIIAVVQTRELESALLKLRIPVVNISNVLESTQLPLVTQDDEQVGRLAAEHLMACGCTSFAYWAQRDALFSAQRVRGFCEALKSHNPDVLVFSGECGAIPVEQGPSLVARMRKWLKKLPPQTGVFAVLDPFALHLLEAAREEKLQVPEYLAVLGAGDDEFWVDFERIPLSSVKLPSWQIGVQAARLLETMMRDGAKGGQTTVKVPITEVAGRRSTDVLFSRDVAVKRAIAYIREHASENIYTEDVVRASGVSRSNLQRRFVAKVGHSVLTEIQRTRIKRVQQFLRMSDLKLEAIAEACDFPSAPRLHVLFKQITGQTPHEYRVSVKTR